MFDVCMFFNGERERERERTEGRKEERWNKKEIFSGENANAELQQLLRFCMSYVHMREWVGSDTTSSSHPLKGQIFVPKNISMEPFASLDKTNKFVWCENKSDYWFYFLSIRQLIRSIIDFRTMFMQMVLFTG